MMKKLLSMLLILCLLAGCAAAPEDNSPQVYRVTSPEYRTHGSLLMAEKVSLRNDETHLDALIRALSGAVTDTRVYNPLSGITLIGCEVRDNLAVLTLSDEYNKLSAYDKTLVDACCTLSLCSVSGIDRVSIAAGNTIVTAGLTAGDMYLSAEDDSRGSRNVCLYYTDKSGENLVPVYRTISTDSAERYVVAELLKAPSDLTSPLPEGTELLGVTRKGRSCTLNLSHEFLDNRPNSAQGELISLYALVNSLATLGSISEVSITVEGEAVERYVNLSLANPLSPLSLMPIEELGRQTLSCRIYLSHGESLVAVPCVVENSSLLKQDLLNHLMGSGNIGIYTSLFSKNDELQHIRTTSGVCRITVSRSFFERRSPDNARLALNALALTLLELEDVGSLVVTYPDGSTPRLPGMDLSQPILSIDADILK